jgi:hypothetical protein
MSGAALYEPPCYRRCEIVETEAANGDQVERAIHFET